MLLIQSQQRNKMTDEYIDKPKHSNQMTWIHTIELFKNYLSLSSTSEVHTLIYYKQRSGSLQCTYICRR